MFTLRKAIVVGVGAAVALTAPGTLASATAAAPQTRLLMTGGSTSLALAPATAKALTANHIKVTPISEARATKRGISFPITGGLVDPKTLAGQITHTGGLTFAAGGKSLTIRDFTANTSATGMSAYVDQLQVRTRVLNLNLNKIQVTVTKTGVRVLNVKVTLYRDAASALNSYFGTKLFKAGLPIGTARIDAAYRMVTLG